MRVPHAIRRLATGLLLAAVAYFAADIATYSSALAPDLVHSSEAAQTFWAVVFFALYAVVAGVCVGIATALLFRAADSRALVVTHVLESIAFYLVIGFALVMQVQCGGDGCDGPVLGYIKAWALTGVGAALGNLFALRWRASRAAVAV